MSKRVLVFGSFDPLHKGHRYLFKQAKERGEYLIVVVSRDSGIIHTKRREPQINEQERVNEVSNDGYVNEVVLGDEWPNNDPYRLLEELEFDVLGLGYDQLPNDDKVRWELEVRGKEGVEVVRFKALKSRHFNSTRLRGPDT